MSLGYGRRSTLLRGLTVVALGLLLVGAEALAEQRTERLVRQLLKGPLRVRLQAALLLGKLGDKAAIGPLQQTLSDPLAALRAAAAASLGQLQATDSADALVKLLDDSESAVRVEAARALGALRVPGAVNPLARKLDDTDPKTREAVARALAAYKDEQVVRPLADALLRGETAAEVHTIGRELLTSLRGKLSLDPYLKALRDGADKHERARAAKVLEFAGDQRAVDALIGALSDKDPFVRMMAAQALRGIGDVRAIAPLEALVERERNDRVVRVAKSSLTVLKNRRP